MYIYSFSRSSRLLLIYGIFAVLCQSVGILFLAATPKEVAGDLCFHRYFPMLEHSLVSFIAILIGVLGLEYISKQSERD